MLVEAGQQCPPIVSVAEVGTGRFRIHCNECGLLRGRWFNRDRAVETAVMHTRYKHNLIFNERKTS